MPSYRSSGVWCSVGEELAAPLLDEEPGQLEVALLAGRLPELDQRQLDLRDVRNSPCACRAEDRVDVVGQLGRDGEEVLLARGPVVRHGRLDHVPGAVELVVVAEVGPPPARLLDGVIAVEIAIRELRRGELGDDLVEPLRQHRIGVRGERVRGRLERLVDVGVHEHRPGEPAPWTWAPASSRFLSLPDFSSISKLSGIETVRLISCRGLQKESWIRTSVNGTGRSFNNRGSSASTMTEESPATSSPATATNRLMRRILFESIHTPAGSHQVNAGNPRSANCPVR